MFKFPLCRRVVLMVMDITLPCSMSCARAVIPVFLMYLSCIQSLKCTKYLRQIQIVYNAQFSFVTMYKVGKCMMPMFYKSVQILKVV